MNDLNIAIAGLGTICVLALCAGSWLTRSQRPCRVHQIATGASVMMVVYIVYLWNQPILASLVPVSGLVILANWLPIWGCFFTGIYVATSDINHYRRAIISSATLLLCVYSAIAPLTGVPPVCSSGPSADSGLQYQSTPFTCSAACAASLLRLHGIAATEGEMAELCLTREGTHWMGLFRGLKLKTVGTLWDVVVEPIGNDGDVPNRYRPTVLSINIDTSGFAKGVDHGFQTDRGHSVVYLRSRGNDRITVFDPSPDFGIDHWDHRVLSCIKSGVAVFLIPRDPNDQKALQVSRRLGTALLNRTLTSRL